MSGRRFFVTFALVTASILLVGVLASGCGKIEPTTERNITPSIGRVFDSVMDMAHLRKPLTPVAGFGVVDNIGERKMVCGTVADIKIEKFDFRVYHLSFADGQRYDLVGETIPVYVTKGKRFGFEMSKAAPKSFNYLFDVWGATEACALDEPKKK